MQQAPQTPQEKGFLESITGGEKWSDMSGKRKGWLIVLLIFTLISTIEIFVAASQPPTDAFGNPRPNPAGSLILSFLILYGSLWLWALVIYPRRKRRQMSGYEFRPSSQQSGYLQQRTGQLAQTPPTGTGSLSASSSSSPTSAPQVTAPKQTDSLGREVQQLPSWMLKDEERQKAIPVAEQETEPEPLDPTPPKGRTQEKPTVQLMPAELTKDMPLIVLGRDTKTGDVVSVTQASRRQGLYIIGTNGTGKSTLIANLIAQDMQQGLGLCLLDPHGDLTKDVLSRVPANRVKDVILLDLVDSSYPFGLNLFACPDPNDSEQVALTSSFVMHVFEKIWQVGTQTPLLAQVLRNCTYTLISNPETTLAEIPLMLLDTTARGKLIATVRNSQVKLFWTSYNKLRPSEQAERTSSTLNKVDAFLTQPISANIISQGKTTLDFRAIMDSGKILLVQLSPRLQDISSLVGAVIIGQLLNAALSRKDIPESSRKQFNLYADEYQRFATEDFATLLSEARKFGIATTIAHQYREQLDFANKGASTNTLTKVVFRVSGEDGIEMAKEFDSTPPPPEVIGQRPILVPKQDVIKHLIEQGHPNPAAMAFQMYLQAFQEWTGEKLITPHAVYGSGIVGGAIAYARNRNAVNKFDQARQLQAESRMMLHDLNAWFYFGMQTHNSSLELPHQILLTAATVAYFDKLLRPFPSHEREIALLCSPDPQRWEEARALLVRGRDQAEQFERCLSFLQSLRTTFSTLCEEPVLVDSGRHEPIYDKPRTYADVQNEIATRLANLPNYQAKIKTGSGEYTIQTLPPAPGVSGSGFDDRRMQIQQQTRASYCRPRSEVEQEIAARHEDLTRDDSPKSSRHESV